MAIAYSFTTKWETPAPLNEVWEAIRNSLDWPEWWKSFTDVTELNHGDENGIGGIYRYTLKSPTHYKLTFDLQLTERIEHKKLEGKASGELEGTGTWLFEEKNGITFIECIWNVKTTQRWMNALAFILMPLFKYNHRMVMKKGGQYLAKKLNAQVIDVS